jgi:hypothetical protein
MKLLGFDDEFRRSMIPQVMQGARPGVKTPRRGPIAFAGVAVVSGVAIVESAGASVSAAIAATSSHGFTDPTSGATGRSEMIVETASGPRFLRSGGTTISDPSSPYYGIQIPVPPITSDMSLEYLERSYNDFTVGDWGRYIDRRLAELGRCSCD